MSGGSWDYFYGRLGDVALRLQCERDPLRKAHRIVQMLAIREVGNV